MGSLAVAGVTGIAFLVTTVHLCYRRLWKIVAVQMIAIGYFAFGAWCVYEVRIRKVSTKDAILISQNMTFSLDSLYHWIICSVYLKAAYVMPYLFNSKLYKNDA